MPFELRINTFFKRSDLLFFEYSTTFLGASFLVAVAKDTSQANLLSIEGNFAIFFKIGFYGLPNPRFKSSMDVSS